MINTDKISPPICFAPHLHQAFNVRHLWNGKDYCDECINDFSSVLSQYAHSTDIYLEFIPLTAKQVGLKSLKASGVAFATLAGLACIDFVLKNPINAPPVAIIGVTAIGFLYPLINLARYST